MLNQRTIDRLSPSDWVLIGYLIGLLLIFFAEHLSGQPDDTQTKWTEQTVSLDEDHLQRLEDGETIKIDRWHGHDLVLGGGMVIDADNVETGTDGDT